MTENTFGPSKEQFKDWMAMWHVEITERPRHLWPNKWTITGWYADEKHLFNKYEYKWDKEEDIQIEDQYKKIPEQERLNHMIGYDHLHYNVETPSWSLHKDGMWRKSLVNNDIFTGISLVNNDIFTGIYDSYEDAIATLAKLHPLPKRFEDYENHLEQALQEKYKKRTSIV